MPASSYHDSLCMWGSKPVILDVLVTAEVNATVLPPGVYTLASDVALFFLQGDDDTVEADDESNYLPAGGSVEFEVRYNPATDATEGGFMSVIRAGSDDGRAFFMKPSAEIA